MKAIVAGVLVLVVVCWLCVDLSRAVETGTGTNVVKSLVVQETLTVGGQTRTNWPNAEPATNFVQKTGDTMTGTLTIQTNVIFTYNADRGHGPEILMTIGGGEAVEIGGGANAYGYGAAVGGQANAYDSAVAVGWAANASSSGVAVGQGSDASTSGAAVGYQANGASSGVAVGYQANGVGNVAVGKLANAQGGTQRIAIGQDVVNEVDNSARVRGTLYLDGGTAVLYRASFGSGAWSNLPAGGTGAPETDPVWSAASNSVQSQVNAKLDSNHWAAADSTTNHVKRTGDTMTGNLVIQGAALSLSNSVDRGWGLRPLLTIRGGEDVELGREANGYNGGASIGAYANGYSSGASIGFSANGGDHGAAVGRECSGGNWGAAVGYQAYGYFYGASVGYQANSYIYGAAIGSQANAYYYGTAIGYMATSHHYGVAVGWQANGALSGAALGNAANGINTNVAIGVSANAQGGNERIAIGHNVTNTVNHSAAIRGTLCLDGGTGAFFRASFGGGNWGGMYTDGTNLFFVNITGGVQKVTGL